MFLCVKLNTLFAIKIYIKYKARTSFGFFLLLISILEFLIYFLFYPVDNHSKGGYGMRMRRPSVPGIILVCFYNIKKSEWINNQITQANHFKMPFRTW